MEQRTQPPQEVLAGYQRGLDEGSPPPDRQTLDRCGILTPPPNTDKRYEYPRRQRTEDNITAKHPLHSQLHHGRGRHTHTPLANSTYAEIHHITGSITGEAGTPTSPSRQYAHTFNMAGSIMGKAGMPAPPSRQHTVEGGVEGGSSGKGCSSSGD